ncbi:hypothetical protein [Mangrovimonas cancribranchiae]|uniref:AAA domain-containing protein n=1 Tax=Mangrovimonas cancribranchiae TaxID=3080055 RepID=A0AAU6PA71_9FLAO
MEVVLIQGSPNIGKTTLCKLIEEIIKQNSFKEEARERRPNDCRYEQDFTAIYNNESCRIIINSESEKEGIDRLAALYTKHYNNKGYNVLITAIRPKKDSPRLHKWVKDIYKNNFVNKNEIEIDLDALKQKYKIEDLCSFLKKTLKKDGVKVLNKVKNNLKCKVRVNCHVSK